MKNMTLEAIANACGGKLNASSSDRTKEVKGVVLDSRKVEKDFLFIATVGERVDGHDFITEVFEKGALCVICEKEPEAKEKAYILVENSFVALMEIAAYYRTQIKAKVIGITGSVGKTTTKEFIASVLAERFKVLKTEGNYNNEVGLPLTILQIRDEHEVAVLELGISHFGEMERMAAAARPDISVMTNIGQCHLEFLGNREGVLKAKSEMLSYMTIDGVLCSNGDDDMLITIKKPQADHQLHFGIGTHNQIYAKNIVNKGLFGTACTIHTPIEEFDVVIPLPGQHMIYNACAAASVAHVLGLSGDEIKAGIEKVVGIRGRSNIISTSKYTLIDDCYNANPVSMKAALDLLAMANTRKVAILGDMGELGEDSAKMHANVGEYAAARNLALLICIGEKALAMWQGALVKKDEKSVGSKILYYATKEEAISHLRELLENDDTILLKASHSMKFEEILKYLQGE